MIPAEQDQHRPLIEHLRELRSRLLNSLVCVLLVFLCLLPFSSSLYTLLSRPLLEKLPLYGGGMIATQVASPFFTPLKLCFFFAVFVCMPWILYQLWCFIAPGLYRREQRAALPILLSSVLLFYCGCLFAYFVVLPLIFSFFLAVVPEGVSLMADIHHYMNFVILLFFAFGIAFEIPIATWIVIRSGLASRETLRRNRAWVIVFAFVAGMLLTPPDVLSQILLAIPIWLLFEIGLLLSR